MHDTPSDLLTLQPETLLPLAAAAAAGAACLLSAPHDLRAGNTGQLSKAPQREDGCRPLSQALSQAIHELFTSAPNRLTPQERTLLEGYLAAHLEAVSGNGPLGPTIHDRHAVLLQIQSNVYLNTPSPHDMYQGAYLLLKHTADILDNPDSHPTATAADHAAEPFEHAFEHAFDLARQRLARDGVPPPAVEAYKIAACACLVDASPSPTPANERLRRAADHAHHLSVYS